MRLVMFVRIPRCPEYQSSYLPFEENHAHTKCANLTTETVFKKIISSDLYTSVGGARDKTPGLFYVFLDRVKLLSRGFEF